MSELEALCGRMERALVRREWAEIDGAIADARRVTHALQNAMEEAACARTPAFDDGILKRLRHVGAIRENQMKRIAHYRDAVGERMQLLARWRAALRSIPARAGSGRALDDIR